MRSFVGGFEVKVSESTSSRDAVSLRDPVGFALTPPLPLPNRKRRGSELMVYGVLIASNRPVPETPNMDPMEFHEKALQAKERAEQSFKEKDFEGAIASALEAKSLDPNLPGLPQMLAAFCVHLAAAKDSTDWYAILGIGPSDEKETVKKQYRRLCILVHPDKNPSSAADSAFKLITEACNRLLVSLSSADATEPERSGPSQYVCRLFCRQCGTSFEAAIWPKTTNVECIHCGASIKLWSSFLKDTDDPPELLELKPASASDGARLRGCPGTCPHCGTWYSSSVEAERCIRRCKPPSYLVEFNIDYEYVSDEEPAEDEVEQAAEEFVWKFDHIKFSRMGRRRTSNKI